MNASIPIVDLMTRRDRSLSIVYGNAVLNRLVPGLPELKDRLQQLEQRKRLIEKESSWRKRGVAHGPMVTTEADEFELPEINLQLEELTRQLADMKMDQEVLSDQTLWLVAKREGFLAGLHAAAVAYQKVLEDPNGIMELMRAQADTEFADQVLHRITRNMPTVDGNIANNFPVADTDQSGLALAKGAGGRC